MRSSGTDDAAPHPYREMALVLAEKVNKDSPETKQHRKHAKSQDARKSFVGDGSCCNEPHPAYAKGVASNNVRQMLFAGDGKCCNERHH